MNTDIEHQKSLEAIVFDLSEVILTGLLGAEIKLSSILDVNPESAYKFLHPKTLSALFKGQITETQHLEYIIKKNDLNITKKRLGIVIRNNFSKIKDSYIILQELYRKKIPLYLISNHAKEWVRYCNMKFQHERFFRKIFYSFETQLIKPNKESYINLINKTKLNPSRTLMIDDSSINIKTANQLGFQTMEFKSTIELEQYLSIREILDI